MIFLVSIIIPVYNCEQYIHQCIDSVLRQTYREIEIILIDDGSTDNSVQILDNYRNVDKRVKVIHKNNEGVSIARNVGIDVSRGKYCAFIDADDFIHPNYISYLVHLAESNNVNIAISSQCRDNFFESIKEDDRIQIVSAENGTALFLSPHLIVGCWNKIFNRDFLIRNNLYFNPELFYGEGLHFICMAAKHSNGIAIGMKKYYNYRRNNPASATTRFNIEKLINGQKSLDLIASNVDNSSKQIQDMLTWHQCQFKMGAIVKIRESNNQNNYRDYYKSCLEYVRKNLKEIIKIRGISMYKKSLLVGCSISPYILTKLFSLRKRIISKISVS